MRRPLTILLCAAVIGLTGCQGETALSQATGKGVVRGINAISTSPEIALLIEERLVTSVTFGTVSPGVQYDDLSYVFNFEVAIPRLVPDDPNDPNSPTSWVLQTERVASLPQAIVKDVEYTFVVSGALDAPAITVWERPRSEVSEGDANFEMQLGHASPATGAFDAYILDPATAPAVGNETGSLSFGEILPLTSLAAGDYVLTLTAVGDPGNVLYQSETLTIAGGNAMLFTIFDTDANINGPALVQMANLTAGVVTQLPDINSQGTVRFHHATINLGAADIYADDPLTTPVWPDHVFREITPDIDLPNGPLPITYTTAGNIGSILIDTDVGVSPGQRRYILLIEDSTGNGELVSYVPQLRSVETQARVAIANTAQSNAIIDVYILPSGEILDDAIPLLNGLLIGVSPVNIPLLQGDYDLYITADDNKVPLAGPIPISPNFGEVWQAIVYDNALPDTVDVVLTPLP
ncbi:MAG: hypothetical protein GWN47_10710 [Woeseiaceae bacterium]|nr:hypothetical protein [Woeseiaceae bacterium]